MYNQDNIYVLPDTNILISDPNVIERLVDRNYYVVISITLLDELDNFKIRKDLSFKAREIGRIIENSLNQKNEYLILTNNIIEIPGLNMKKADDRILATALYYKQQRKKVILLTNDRFLSLKAKGLDVSVAPSINELCLNEFTAQNNRTIPVNKMNREIDSSSFLPIDKKRQILRAFTELSEVQMKDGRINYRFEGSRHKKKTIVRELSHTGNGYLYVEYLEEYKNHKDNRGWVSIKNYGEEDLKELIKKAIESFK